MSHTKGPWEAKPSKANYWRWVIWSKDACIAETANWLTTDDHTEEADNARLIAAAPELLEDLITVCNQYRYLHGQCNPPAWIINAEITIAKARGVS